MDFLAQNGGNTLSSYMPYTASAGNCTPVQTMAWAPKTMQEIYTPSFNSKLYPATAAAGDCNRLKALLAYGPVSAAVFANSGFMQYKSGAFSDPSCPKDGSVNHAVVVTAFIKNFNGTTDDVFKVRNSWATTWGNQGYIYVKADGNVCGICSYLLYLEP